MADREKVIEHLVDLKERLKLQADIEGYGYYIDFVNDAITILREQEDKKPKPTNHYNVWLCPKCGFEVHRNWMHCHRCGTKLNF